MAEPPTSAGVVTAEELLYLNLPDKQTELVRGSLIVREPPGYQHGLVALEIARLIANHAADHSLGVAVAAETGFISQGRAPDPPPTGYLTLAPDLAVEVVSPNDRAGEVQGKVSDWLTAGSRLVWVIDPVRRRAVIYRADGSVALLAEHDALEGEDVLPGFGCPLTDLW